MQVREIKTSSGQQYTLTYNKAGLLESISDNLKRTIQYKYTDRSLSEVIDEAGDIVKYEYENNYLTKIIKPDKKTIEIEYGAPDERGNRKTIATKDEEGNRETFAYETREEQLKITHSDYKTIKTEIHLNKENQKTKESPADGAIIEYEYNTKEQKISETKNGNTTKYEYDRRSNISKIIYSDNSTEEFTYGSSDELLRYKSRDNEVRENTYDENGNLISVKQNGKTIYELQYDERGNKTAVYAGRVLKASYEYNENNLRIKKIIGSSVEQYEYDGLNRLVKITDALGRVSTYEYGNHYIKETTAQGLEKTYTYNSRKDINTIEERDTHTDEKRITHFDYYGNHNLKSITRACGEKTHFSYRNNLLIKKQCGVWSEEYEYDKTGRIKKRTSCKGEERFVQEYNYAYTPQGMQKEITNGLNETTSYSLDHWNRLIQQTNAVGETFTKEISAGGKIQKESSASGGTITYKYKDGLLSEAGKENDETIKSEYNLDGSIKMQTTGEGEVIGYEYDEADRIKKITKSSGFILYEYDKIGRVICETYHTNYNDKKIKKQYKYDDDKNEITEYSGTYAKTYKINAWGEVIKETDANGKHIEYTYNANGNLIQVKDTCGIIAQYEYNEIGLRQKQINALGQIIAYEYNGLAKIKTIKDCNGILFTCEYDKAGRISEEKKRGETKKNYEYDKTGRITKISSNGKVLEEYSYGAFGKIITVKDANGNTYLYEKDGYGLPIKETNRLNKSEIYYYNKDDAVIKTEKKTDTLLKANITIIQTALQQSIKTEQVKQS